MSIELLANQGRDRVHGGLAAIDSTKLRQMRDNALRSCFTRFGRYHCSLRTPDSKGIAASGSLWNLRDRRLLRHLADLGMQTLSSQIQAPHWRAGSCGQASFPHDTYSPSLSETRYSRAQDCATVYHHRYPARHSEHCNTQTQISTRSIPIHLSP